MSISRVSEIGKFFNTQASLAQDGTLCFGRKVSAVHWQRDQAVSTAELKMTSALAHFGKSGFLQSSKDFFRSQDRKARRHWLRHASELLNRKIRLHSAGLLKGDFRREAWGADK